MATTAVGSHDRMQLPQRFLLWFLAMEMLYLKVSCEFG